MNDFMHKKTFVQFCVLISRECEMRQYHPQLLRQLCELS